MNSKKEKMTAETVSVGADTQQSLNSCVKNSITNTVQFCKSKTVKLINMENVEVEEVNWLFHPYIPFGKITIIEGDAGEGKTTLILQIIAKLTRGEDLIIDEDNEIALKTNSTPMNVIYQTAEDGLGDTIKPRLLAAQADCSRVTVIDDTDKALSMTDERLEAAISMLNARLVVLDPIQAYLGANVNMNSANEVRPVLKHLSDLAQKYNCAIVLIGHIGKSALTRSNQRLLGSVDFGAAARSVLLVGRLKEEPETRVVIQTKNNLAAEVPAITFILNKEEGFNWGETIDITADELLSGTQHTFKKDSAIQLLNNMLSEGEQLQKEIEAAAKMQGISLKTLRNAKRELGVQSHKHTNQWYWRLGD